jgi:hypothetical protein
MFTCPHGWRRADGWSASLADRYLVGDLWLLEQGSVGRRGARRSSLVSPRRRRRRGEDALGGSALRGADAWSALVLVHLRSEDDDDVAPAAHHRLALVFDRAVERDSGPSVWPYNERRRGCLLRVEARAAAGIIARRVERDEERALAVAVGVAPEAAAAGGTIGDDEDFLFFAVDEAPRAALHEVEAGIDCLVDRGGAPQIPHVDVGRR